MLMRLPRAECARSRLVKAAGWMAICYDLRESAECTLPLLVCLCETRKEKSLTLAALLRMALLQGRRKNGE